MFLRDLPPEIKCLIIPYLGLPYTSRAVFRVESSYLYQEIRVGSSKASPNRDPGEILLEKPNGKGSDHARQLFQRLRTLPRISIDRTISDYVFNFCIAVPEEIELNSIFRDGNAEVMNFTTLHLESYKQSVYSGAFYCPYDVITELNSIAQANAIFPPKVVPSASFEKRGNNYRIYAALNLSPQDRGEVILEQLLIYLRRTVRETPLFQRLSKQRAYSVHLNPEGQKYHLHATESDPKLDEMFEHEGVLYFTDKPIVEELFSCLSVPLILPYRFDDFVMRRSCWGCWV